MRSRSVLITQCLQKDFVQPIGRQAALPNLLHVGHAEARRLLGEDPETGPLARFMHWAYRQPAEALQIVHIRDWHSRDDPEQREHLRRFGEHCIAGSDGAELCFATDAAAREVDVVDALTLNDFRGTRLGEVLGQDLVESGRPRLGLVGVWTEAKVTFLAYELRTRYPWLEIATCSALTAGSSRAQHANALEQLRRLLGVEIFASIGEFSDFLAGSPGSSGQEQLEAAALGSAPGLGLELEVSGTGALGATDASLCRYLFRDCRSARLRLLQGGYSGNLVLASESVDAWGHAQVPHVLKIGPRALIGQERAAFEQIEAVLGNSAPRIAEFVDLAGRGAIKYRYASMGGGGSTTFQSRWRDGLDLGAAARIFDSVFGEQLGRLYAAATPERCDLLDYYGFRAGLGPDVSRLVAAVAGGAARGAELEFPGGRRLPSVARFYSEELGGEPGRRADEATLSYVHGDLNAANILLDGRDNVWLIDFFHSHRGHVLRDLVKLENDLLYILTPLADEADLAEGMSLSDALDGAEPALPLPEAAAIGLSRPALARSWEAVRLLRSYHGRLLRRGADDGLALLAGRLRYAVHTLSFDESSPLQKRWALYTACLSAAALGVELRRPSPLRVDWLDRARTRPGRLGLTLLPGRKDRGRELRSDVAALEAAGVTDVVCLIQRHELARYGVVGLFDAYHAMGLAVRELPIPDGGVPEPSAMQALVGWLRERTAGGASVAVHCAGGLGRAGTVAACYLRTLGVEPADAIAEVRRARSPRAIETSTQERFIAGFPS